LFISAALVYYRRRSLFPLTIQCAIGISTYQRFLMGYHILACPCIGYSQIAYITYRANPILVISNIVHITYSRYHIRENHIFETLHDSLGKY
jgi:hypothetical protein